MWYSKKDPLGPKNNEEMVLKGVSDFFERVNVFKINSGEPIKET